MGVNLGNILESKKIDIEGMNNKIIAVDAYNIIYQFLSSIRQSDGTPLKDSKGRITSHLSGILYRCSNLIHDGLSLIFVYDGKPDIMKEGTLEKRKARKKEAEIEYQKALKEGDLVRARMKAQQTSRMDDEIENSSKKLLDLMGIPWVQAPAEGESQASYIVSKGDAWAVGSQDYDSLLFGAKKLVRNLTITGKRKLPGKDKYKEIKPELLDLENILKKLGINRKQLIDIGILCGTDYNEGIKGIGPKRGLKYIKEYGSLEGFLEEKDKDINNFEKIREIFLRPNVTDSYETNFKDPDIQGIKVFLCKERDFSESRVQSALDKIPDTRKTDKQTSLSSFG
ncbi:MAG: flap endonuclease-1 [Thermoplasmatota archaeon]